MTRLRVPITTQGGFDGDLFIDPSALESIEDRARGRCYITTHSAGFVVPMSAVDFETACRLHAEIA